VRPVARTASNDTAAFWSPDGSKIAFTTDRGGNHEIFVMGADGGNARRLTTSPGIKRSAVWSPDGRRILFATEGEGDNALFVMDADGSNVTRIVPR
jgi:TolB protein